MINYLLYIFFMSINSQRSTLSLQLKSLSLLLLWVNPSKQHFTPHMDTKYTIVYSNIGSGKDDRAILIIYPLSCLICDNGYEGLFSIVTYHCQLTSSYVLYVKAKSYTHNKCRSYNYLAKQDRLFIISFDVYDNA